ncbi:MAG: MATE family efflux transporter [Erysipelotrichaceae bacterium]
MEKTLKKSSITSMTQGKPLKLIFFFALPLMFGNVFQQLYTVTDTAIVGKVLGVGALAALGVVDWLNWMMLGIVQGFTQGFSILIAQKYGAREYDKLKKAVGNSIVLAAVLSIVICILAELLIPAFMVFLRAPEETVPIATAYLRVMFLGIPVMMIYNMASALLRALGDSKTPLQAMVFASLVNIGLDLLFVMVFKWGVEGAALATVIAQILASFYCIKVINRIELLKIKKSDLGFENNYFGSLLRLGAPMAFQNMIIAIGGMVVQIVVNGYGVAFIAGFTATTKLYGVLEVAATSYGYAMVTYTGQNIGAGEYDRVSKGVRSGLFIGIITSLIITLVMFVFGKQILSLFVDSSETLAAETLEIGFRYLKIMSTFLPVLYVLHILRSTIQGMGNTMLPMVSGIFELIMRVGASFILPLLFGETGILFAEISAWMGADLILIPGYIVNRKRLDDKN